MVHHQLLNFHTNSCTEWLRHWLTNTYKVSYWFTSLSSSKTSGISLHNNERNQRNWNPTAHNTHNKWTTNKKKYTAKRSRLWIESAKCFLPPGSPSTDLIPFMFGAISAHSIVLASVFCCCFSSLLPSISSVRIRAIWCLCVCVIWVFF